MRVSIDGASVASGAPRRASGCFIAAALSCSVFACASGADDTRFIPTAGVDGLSPAQAPADLAPGVDEIVFRSDRDQEGVGDLYVMAADGSNVRRLTEGGDFSVPVWASDGRSIAFRQVTGLDSVIGLIAPDGGEPVRLVPGGDPLYWDRPLTWSGADIIYALEPGLLWAISRSGGQGRPLPPVEGVRDSADFSRVDSRVVFEWTPGWTPDGPDVAETQDLFLADGPDDTELENLTQGRVYAPSGPRWSPDGNRVLFYAFVVLPDGSIEGFGAHGAEGNEALNLPDTELFMVDVRTHELTRLTDTEADESFAAWTADGAHVIYASGSDDVDEDIFKLAIDGASEPVNLIDDDDEPGADSMPDCFWGVAPAK